MTFQWCSPSTSPGKYPLPQRTLVTTSHQVSQLSEWLPGFLQTCDLTCYRTQFRRPRDEQKMWLDLQAQVGEFTHRVNKNSPLFLTFIQSIFKKKNRILKTQRVLILAPHVPGHQEKKRLSFATTCVSDTLSVDQCWSLRRHRCVMGINRPQISLWKTGYQWNVFSGSSPI